MTLRMRGVTKRFAGRTILAGIDLEVGPREQVAITGENGAGKTTLLRVAAGISPAKGMIEAPAKTGVHLQDAPCYRELSALDHLRFWQRLHGQEAETASLRRLLAEAGLPADGRAATLSRGQRQRLGLLLAFTGEPRLLLLDEPYASLDEKGRAWLTAALAATDAAVLMSVQPGDPRPSRVLRLHQGVLT